MTALAIPQYIDRRQKQRFPIVLELSYTIPSIHLTNSGVTVNLCSHGALFTSNPAINSNLEGRNILLRIDWPVLLHGIIPMLLIAKGRIVWVKERECAVRFRSTEFTTRRAKIAVVGR